MNRSLVPSRPDKAFKPFFILTDEIGTFDDSK